MGQSTSHIAGRSIVSNEHGNDVWVCVLTQLFNPCLDVAEG